MKPLKKPELLAPVGNGEMLVAAINGGCDSVYLGVKGFNMRANATNFSTLELAKAVKYAHDHNIRVYVCINTIIYENELNKLKKVLMACKKSNVDAIICWDMAVIKLARELKLEIHLSTQASTSNSYAISEYSKLGIKRLVLARETSLKEIKKIKKTLIKTNSKIEIEAFIHGAMCVSVSGRCFISEYLYKRSANRGDCIQPCRRSYLIKDPETGKELTLDNHYVMSPRDLCTIEIIDKLIQSGIDCFKIEGRNRSPEYVKTTVESYKDAIDQYFKKKLTQKKKKELIENLRTVYNRGFSKGFYHGRPITDWTDSYGSKSTLVKTYIGYVNNYYSKSGAMEIKLETGELKIGDNILVIGPTTGCGEYKITSMQINNLPVERVSKGKSVGIMINALVRKNDKVYLWKKR